MRRLISLCFGFGLGLLAMYLAFNIHVVRTSDDWHFVKKQEVELTDFYADIRKWDADEWARHPELSRALVDSGNGELLPEAEPEDLIFDVLKRWESARREESERR